ncbi:MAG: trypsin-like serine protease [Planctomycetota bacterium]
MPEPTPADPTRRRTWRRGTMATVGSLTLLSGLMVTGAAGAITIRDNQSYPAQDAALLTDDGALLDDLAGNLVQVGVGSGIYLGDGWVLSAAHFNPDTGGRATVSFESGLTTGGDVFRHPGVAFITDDGGTRQDFTVGNDFALIQLDTTPTGLPDVALFGGASEDLNNQVVTLFGYGATGTGDTGSDSPESTTGTLHAGENRVDQVGGSVFNNNETYTDQVVFFDFDRPTGFSDNPLGTRFALTYESMIAVGDSGGGLFIDNEGTATLTGVHSLLFSPNNAPTAGYGSIGASTTVDGVLGWIAATTNNAVVQAGDANLNGTVEQGDLNAVLNNWGETDRSWSTGDLTDDGNVDQADLNAVLNNWGASQAPSFEAFTALPEPAFAAASLLGLASLRRRTR